MFTHSSAQEFVCSLVDQLLSVHHHELAGGHTQTRSVQYCEYIGTRRGVSGPLGTFWDDPWKFKENFSNLEAARLSFLKTFVFSRNQRIFK